MLKERLQNKEFLFGPFVNLCHPAVLEIAGFAGFDFAIIDTEHGEISTDRAVEMVRAAKLAGISPVVRVYGNQPELISKALDIGADAVQIPQVSSREEAEGAVYAAKFSPEGGRGANRYVRAARYSAMDKAAYFRKANQETAVIVQVEGKAGLDRLADIITVPGIDVLFIGPYDLSASLGIPGQVEHPLIMEAMHRTIQLARQAGVAIGFFVDDAVSAVKWKKAGVQYISFAADVGLLYNAFRQSVAIFREE